MKRFAFGIGCVLHEDLFEGQNSQLHEQTVGQLEGAFDVLVLLEDLTRKMHLSLWTLQSLKASRNHNT